MPPGHQQNNFDFVRMAAASLVLISHMFALSGRIEPIVGNEHVTLGSIGVFIFFSISGYLVCQSLLRDPSPVRFLVRRLLRLWPALAVVIVLCAYVIAPLSLDKFHIGGPNHRFLKNLLFHPEYIQLKAFTGNPIPLVNGSLWTIPTEFWCYVTALILFILLRPVIAYVLPGLLLAGLISYQAAGGQNLFDALPQVLAPLHVMALMGSFFLLGAIISVFQDFLLQAWIVLLAQAVSCALIVEGQTMLGLVCSIPFAINYFGNSSSPCIRRFGRFGDFSYGFYLYAWPVQQCAVENLGRNSPYLLLLLVSAVGALTCAALSWHLIEGPALQWKRKFVGSRRSSH